MCRFLLPPLVKCNNERGGDSPSQRDLDRLDREEEEEEEEEE